MRTAFASSRGTSTISICVRATYLGPFRHAIDVDTVRLFEAKVMTSFRSCNRPLWLEQGVGVCARTIRRAPGGPSWWAGHILVNRARVHRSVRSSNPGAVPHIGASTQQRREHRVLLARVWLRGRSRRLAGRDLLHAGRVTSQMARRRRALVGLPINLATHRRVAWRSPLIGRNSWHSPQQ